MKIRVSRRDILMLLALGSFGLALGVSLTPTEKNQVESLLRELRDASSRLSRGDLSVAQWLTVLEGFNSKLDAERLARAIRIDEIKKLLRRRSGIPSYHIELPGLLSSERRQIKTCIYGFKRGSVIPLHAHNNLVSSHFVLDGDFDIARAERRFEFEDKNRIAVSELQTGRLGVGGYVTQSEGQFNLHEFHCRSKEGYIFYTAIKDVDQGQAHINAGNADDMIYVDRRFDHTVTGEGRDVVFSTPVLTAQEALRRARDWYSA